MICEKCQVDSADVTDRGACMVAECWECQAECPRCQDDLADEAGVA